MPIKIFFWFEMVKTNSYLVKILVNLTHMLVHLGGENA